MIKTDNSYLADKVALRLAHLPDKKTVRVLDCFAGKGVIWQAVRKLAPGRDIRVLPIEVKPQEEDVLFYLPGDNTRFLETLDLGRFDVIDLDAYGVPYDQLRTIFRRGYKGVIFVTLVHTKIGTLPHPLLRELGLTSEMINKCPALVASKNWTWFLQYLALHGIRRFLERVGKGQMGSQYHYMVFSCGGGADAKPV